MKTNSTRERPYVTMKIFEACLEIHLSHHQAKILLDCLIKMGFKVNGFDGFRPLDEAIYYKHYEIADQLLNHGANIEEDIYNGNTPLHCAIKRVEYDLCKFLLDKGASYEIRNGDNLNAIELAKKQKVDKITDLIIEKTIRDDKFETFDVLENIKLDECVLCFKPRKEVFAFKPCNHAKTCQRCALTIMYKSFGKGTCPVCRARIKKVQKITNANDFMNFYI